MHNEDLNYRFIQAVNLAETFSQHDLRQDDALRCYAYYKQATSGMIDNQHTMNFDLRNAFKMNAWLQISHLSADEAKEMYIETINTLAKKLKS